VRKIRKGETKMRQKRSSENEKMSLKIPSDSAHLSLVRTIMADLSKKIGFSEEEVAKIEMAVDEACTNIIKYAYKDKRSEQPKNYFARRKEDVNKPIELQMETSNDRFVVTIIDRGKVFNFNSHKSPTLKEYLNMTKPQGLGIRVIRTFMDEVHYNHKPGVGNILRLVKNLPK